MGPHDIVLGDALPILKSLEDGLVDLVYIDPPFNTRSERKKTTFERGRVISTLSYNDNIPDYQDFMKSCLVEAHRVLRSHGSIYVHIDHRESHHIRGILDEVFGEQNFLNEIIWAYDYGGKAKTRWPAKHDTIFFYAKKKGAHQFNLDEVERIPYMSPRLAGPEKAAKGKVVTDVWWHTIVPTNGREKTGYPTQKPMGILKRIISASSNPGDLVLDFFAGSGTTGHVASMLGRNFILVDNNPAAIEIMKKRFRSNEVEFSSFEKCLRAER